MSIDINSGFKVYATSPIDVRYSNNGIPYSSTSSACSSILSTSRFQGLTVLIGTSSTQPYPQEYWWQNGTSDSQLVLKQSLATGNITGSASTGYVALWTGTTSVGYVPGLQWVTGSESFSGTTSYFPVTTLKVGNLLNGNPPSGGGAQTTTALQVLGPAIVTSLNVQSNQSSSIITSGGILAQGTIRGGMNYPYGGGLMIDNGYVQSYGGATPSIVSNYIYSNANFYTIQNITGLNIRVSSTYSGYYNNADTSIHGLDVDLNVNGTYSYGVGVRINSRNNSNQPSSIYTINYTDLLITSNYTTPTGKWSIYNDNNLSNYFAGNLSIGTSFFYGTYSLQANGDVYFRGTGNNNNGLSIQHASPSISGLAIYSTTYKSAFGFYNLFGTSYMRGAVSTGPILSIEDTNSIPSSVNPLTITSKPPSGNAFSSSFNFLTMAVYPELGTIANGASLNQQYYYRDYPTYSASPSNPNAYRPLGLYGVIFESGTFSSENTSFRWKTMINGSLAESMRLLGNNLLIGYTQSQGTYSLQVNGSSLISGISDTNSYMIYGNSSALVLSGNSNYGIYSHSLKAGFLFFNQSISNVLSGNSNAILDIQQTSNTAGNYGLLIRTVPSNMTNGGTGSFNLLNFLSSPGTASNQGLAVNAILNQTYTMYDPIVGSYSSMGDFGSVMLNNIYGSVSSAFRWTTSNNGVVYENMRLQGFGSFGNSQLLIGYTQTQGTYSLQVNGNEYIQGNAKITGYIQMPSNTVPTTETSSFQLYAALSSGSNYDVLTYTGRDGKTFNIGNCILINTLNSGTYSLQPYTVISMDNVGRIVPASPDTYKNTLLGITVDSMNPTTGYGRFVSSGLLKNLNLWNYLLGTPLYVDYGGGLTSSPPVGYPAQSIGTVVFKGSGPSSNDGVLLVNQAGVYTPNWSNLGNDIFNNNTNGNVLIGYTQSQGSARLQVNGGAYFFGSISASGSITAQTGGFDSDLRLKSNIVYNPVIEGIDSIKSASYVIGGNSHIGYIAQDVEDIVPSSIIEKEDGYLALNYNEVLVAKVAYLENKVKELYDIIERNGLK